MSIPNDAFKINPGEVLGWPNLRIKYPTDPAKLAELLPPGLEPSDTSNVHLNIYLIPVPDEPEFGVVIDVDADYRGQKGRYCLGYGIDQESAIYISKDMNGQPKYPCEIDFYRFQDAVSARCTHQGYTFIEFEGTAGEALPQRESHVEYEWWIKVLRAVGGAEKAYDFPPHVVQVKSTYGTKAEIAIDGTVALLDSPWDPIASLLPVRDYQGARLWWPEFLGLSLIHI